MAKKSAARKKKPTQPARSTHRNKPARRIKHSKPARRARAVDVDQKIRINELEAEIGEVTKGKMKFSGVSEECPPEIHEQFLRNVLEYEKADQTTNEKILARKGVTLTPPDSLSDSELTKKLWEVIEQLGRNQTFIYHTDHLSDRECYTRLCENLKSEFVPDMPNVSKNYSYHIDLIGSGSDEDIEIGHRYYASKKEIKRWLKMFPDSKIPEHVDPPYDRDRHLPKHVIPQLEELE